MYQSYKTFKLYFKFCKKSGLLYWIKLLLMATQIEIFIFSFYSHRNQLHLLSNTVKNSKKSVIFSESFSFHRFKIVILFDLKKINKFKSPDQIKFYSHLYGDYFKFKTHYKSIPIVYFIIKYQKHIITHLNWFIKIDLDLNSIYQFNLGLTSRKMLK